MASVFADHLTRRCVRCGRPGVGDPRANEPLPAIRKTLLYVDQFAISNFAILADPAADQRRFERAAPWDSVYQRVKALVGVQKLVCPSSGFHTDEALPQLENETFMRSLDRVQMSLSGGLSFSEALTIELSQLRHAVESALGAVPLDSSQLVAASPFRDGGPHVWMPRLHVGVATASLYAGVVDEVAASLSSQGGALSQAFASWRNLPSSAVNDQFELELASYGPSVVRAFVAAIERASVDPLMYLGSGVVRYRAVRRLFGDLDAPTVDFLQSDAVKVMPKLRIAGAMYAVLARQAANGMREVEASFAIDVAITSTVLPYVDAILVDGRCAEVLRQPPAREEVARWGTTVLSARDLPAVVGWLDGLAAEVTDEHLMDVARVYGQGVVDAFRDVFGRG